MSKGQQSDEDRWTVIPAGTFRVEKRPGWDWDVDFIREQRQETITIFGAMTPETALADARRSISSDDYEIIAMRRRPISKL